MRRRRRQDLTPRYYRPGRPLSGSSRLALLPRALYTPVSNTLAFARARGLLGVFKRPLRKLAAATKPTRRARLVNLLRPTFNGRPNPCVKRATRREVMFAGNVAGNKWGRGSGGPNMRDARRSLSSQLSCKR